MICPSGARGDSAVFQLETVTWISPLIPSSWLAHSFNHRQGYHSHCMCNVCVCVYIWVILSLHACVFHCLVFLFVIEVRTEAGELGLGRFVWCAVCKRILQRVSLCWPSSVCFSGACGFAISSSNYTHWMCLKPAAVAPKHHLSASANSMFRKNDDQIQNCGHLLQRQADFLTDFCFSLRQNATFCQHIQLLAYKIYFALLHCICKTTFGLISVHTISPFSSNATPTAASVPPINQIVISKSSIARSPKVYLCLINNQ